MRNIILIITLSVALSTTGCVSFGTGDVTVGTAPIGRLAAQPIFAGDFSQGLVYFSFVPTGPDHAIIANYSNTSYATYAYAGRFTNKDGEAGPSQGVGMLTGVNSHAISVRGDGAPTVEVIEIPGREGGGAHGLSILEGGWDETWWVAFGAASGDGSAEIELTVLGEDVAILTGPIEAPARLFTERDWNGALDVRVGEGTPGATVVRERSLRFETTNGTFMTYLLGGLTTRVEEIRVENSTSTATWTGATSFTAGITVGLPGGNRAIIGLLGIGAPADEWTLTLRNSVRTSAYHDEVFVADVALPEAFYFLI